MKREVAYYKMTTGTASYHQLDYFVHMMRTSPEPVLETISSGFTLIVSKGGSKAYLAKANSSGTVEMREIEKIELITED
jgi:hypothetical protein